MIQFVKQTGSTNNDMKARTDIATLPNLFTLCTFCQTAGRGQQGNKWESEPDKNISFTTIIRYPEISAPALWIVSEICAIAVAQTLSDSYNINAQVKWPNDIYVGDKKICGILIENVILGEQVVCSLAGIGLNINQTIFRSDAPNPVSMKQLTGIEYDKEEVLKLILANIKKLLTIAPAELKKQYMLLLYRHEEVWKWRRVQNNQTFDAEIVDIDTFGRLILKKQDGQTETFAFKQIQYITTSE